MSYCRIPEIHSHLFALVNPVALDRVAHTAFTLSAIVADSDSGRYRDGYRRVSSRSSPYIRDTSRAACGSPTEQVPGSVPLSERALAVYLVRQPPTWSEITRSSSMLDAGAADAKQENEHGEMRGEGRYRRERREDPS